MKPHIARYTEIIMLAARIAPLFFPAWLRTMAKEYQKDKDAIAEHLHRRKVSTISFIRGDFTWKGVSVVSRLDSDEIEKLHKWYKQKNPTGYLSDFDLEWFQTRFDKVGGFRPIGWIGLKSHNALYRIASLNLQNNCCDSCYATITRASHGIAYLSLYFMLNEDATKKIRNLDVSDIEGYYCFQKFNFYANRGIEHHAQDDAASFELRKNIESVCTDVKAATTQILNWWGIKPKNKHLVLVADLYRDTDEPYFVKERPSEAVQVGTESVYIDRWHSFYDDNLSDDPSESYCHHQLHKDISFDALFIKSKKSENFEKWEYFPAQASEIHNSHLFYSLIWEAMKQYESIASYSNLALLVNKNSIEHNHNTLFKSKSDLNQLKNQLTGIFGLIGHYCRTVYAAHAKTILKLQLQHIKSLEISIDSRIATLDKQIQLQNLKFNKRYSWAVGFLVFVQIVLAVLTGDWSKNATNLKSVTDKLHEFIRVK